MSEDVLGILKGNRGSPPVMTQTTATAFMCQLDKMSVAEAKGWEGAEPHFTYNAYTLGLPTSDPFLVRQTDLFIDQQNTDPLTSTSRQFRIVSDPERFPDGHWEWVCYLYRGK